MGAAAGSYVEWLSATAAQAEETAAQARAAAAGYEAALAMTVPPPVVAANRSLLAALVATNFLGNNTPAIAATEAQYAEMWAQDAVGDVWLRGFIGISDGADAVHFTRPNTNPADGQPGRRGRPSNWHLRGRCAKHCVDCPQTLSAVPAALQSACDGGRNRRRSRLRCRTRSAW